MTGDAESLTQMWASELFSGGGSGGVSTSSAVTGGGPFAVAAAVVDTLLLSPNPTRCTAIVVNSTDTTLYLSLGTNAATPSVYSARLTPNAYYETPSGYTGMIRGIWLAGDADSAGALITELVP